MKTKITGDRIYRLGVLGLTLSIALFLAFNTYYINYWPTDSENPYIPTAAKLFTLPFLSYMHLLTGTYMLKLTMHAKEALILGIAVMQRLLNDYESLYPNVLLLIIATAVSSVLVYFIIKKMFDKQTGFFAFLLFATCFWSYLYILQGAHPPLVLANFLIAIFFLQCVQKHEVFYLLSGMFLGFMLFSSPTSPLYLPYYLGFFLYNELLCAPPKKEIKKILSSCLLLSCGLVSVFLLFTIPHPLISLQQALKFLRFSQFGNNFVIYRNFLSQLFFLPADLRGAGWIWIIKYFFLIMPLMFSVYILCVLYLLVRSFKKPALLLIVLLSASTPLMVETIKVVQFGRNYFSWLAGIIFLLAYVFHQLRNKYGASRQQMQKRLFYGLTVLFLTGHIIFNARVLFLDVFPSRMATTYIYEWLINHRINNIYGYQNHPRYKNTMEFLNNSKIENKVYFLPMNTIKDASSGLILIPTITGKSIWCECREGDFTDDPYLTKLFESGEFDKYVVAKFKTLSSSKIWTQEEEICTYRDLIVGDIREHDRQKGFAWILDADKLQREWFSKGSLK